MSLRLSSEIQAGAAAAAAAAAGNKPGWQQLPSAWLGSPLPTRLLLLSAFAAAAPEQVRLRLLWCTD